MVALQPYGKKVVGSISGWLCVGAGPLLVLLDFRRHSGLTRVCELTVGVSVDGCCPARNWLLSKVSHCLHPGTAGQVSSRPLNLIVDDVANVGAR